MHSKTIIMSNLNLYNFQYQHNFGLELNEELRNTILVILLYEIYFAYYSTFVQIKIQVFQETSKSFLVNKLII